MEVVCDISFLWQISIFMADISFLWQISIFYGRFLFFYGRYLFFMADIYFLWQISPFYALEGRLIVIGNLMKFGSLLEGIEWKCSAQEP